MSTWAELITRALPGPTSGVRAEPLTVRPGEIVTRMGGQGHEVSLIRRVFSEQEWERACAALASQEMFRARLLAGELPPETARVFEVLGLDLVPNGWDSLVSTCSCPEWRGRCLHVFAVATAVAEEASRDPFVLTRWAGSESKSLIARVTRHGAPGNPRGARSVVGRNSGERSVEFSADTPPGSAAAFWRALPPPEPPALPEDLGERVKAAAPGALADELPEINRFET